MAISAVQPRVFPGFIRPNGSASFLELDLHSVDLLHAAIFDGHHMRIKDRTAISLQFADNPVEVIRAGIANDRQGKNLHITAHARDFVMPEQLIAHIAASVQ